LEGLREAFARHPKRAGLLLVEDETQGWDPVVPVVVDVHGVGVGAHDGSDLIGDATNRRMITAEYPELDGIFNRWPDIEPHHTSADVGKRGREDLADPLHHPLPRDVVFGHDHELGEVGIGELLGDEQKEARAAATDVGGVVHDVLIPS
jgi:hypothetical protein